MHNDIDAVSSGQPHHDLAHLLVGQKTVRRIRARALLLTVIYKPKCSMEKLRLD